MQDRKYDLNFHGRLIDTAKEAELLHLEAALHEDKCIESIRFHIEANKTARHYTNIIMVAGYAAFFALWSSVSKDLDSKERLLIAGLLSISLISFVAWEIAKSYVTMMQSDLISTAIWKSTSRSDLAGSVENLERNISLQDQKLQSFWPLSYFTSVSTGLTGGALLAIATMARAL